MHSSVGSTFYFFFEVFDTLYRKAVIIIVIYYSTNVRIQPESCEYFARRIKLLMDFSCFRTGGEVGGGAAVGMRREGAG